jgi:hypothetical protein
VGLSFPLLAVEHTLRLGLIFSLMSCLDNAPLDLTAGKCRARFFHEDSKGSNVAEFSGYAGCGDLEDTKKHVWDTTQAECAVASVPRCHR